MSSPNSGRVNRDGCRLRGAGGADGQVRRPQRHARLVGDGAPGDGGGRGLRAGPLVGRGRPGARSHHADQPGRSRRTARWRARDARGPRDSAGGAGRNETADRARSSTGRANARDDRADQGAAAPDPRQQNGRKRSAQPHTDQGRRSSSRVDGRGDGWQGAWLRPLGRRRWRRPAA